MDLPLDPSVDIYQIHRTPFFRRLHRKDPDEFERVKEAYMNVRHFDEKPLDTQVKKIRLGKLLRRIKDSITKSNRQAKPYRPKPKSKEEVRREELAKARQMGIEFSKQNLMTSVPHSGSERINPFHELSKEKSKRARRLEYGNSKSQINRSRIQKSLENKSADNFVTPLSKSATETTTYSGTVRRLEMLQKTLPKEEFIKFLVHCLSTDKPNSEVMRAFEEVLQTKSVVYWDLVEAIDHRQQFIKRYGKFMKKLSSLAAGCPVQYKSHGANLKKFTCVETFDSKTNIKPSQQKVLPQKPTLQKPPEIYIRTYRYSDKDEYLPSPSESLLRIPEETKEQKPAEDVSEPIKIQNTQSSSNIKEKAQPVQPVLLSNKMIKSLRKHLHKEDIPQTFESVIRDAAKEESVNLLAKIDAK